MDGIITDSHGQRVYPPCQNCPWCKLPGPEEPVPLPPQFDPKIERVHLMVHHDVFNLRRLRVKIPAEFMIEETEENAEVRANLSSIYKVFPDDVDRRLEEWLKRRNAAQTLEGFQRRREEFKKQFLHHIVGYGFWILIDDENQVEEMLDSLRAELKEFGRLIREFLKTLKQDSIRRLFEALMLTWKKAEAPWWVKDKLEYPRDADRIFRCFNDRIEPDVDQLINSFHPQLSIVYETLMQRVAETKRFQENAYVGFKEYLEKVQRTVYWLVGLEDDDGRKVPPLEKLSSALSAEMAQGDLFADWTSEGRG